MQLPGSEVELTYTQSFPWKKKLYLICGDEKSESSCSRETDDQTVTWAYMLVSMWEWFFTNVYSNEFILRAYDIQNTWLCHNQGFLRRRVDPFSLFEFCSLYLISFMVVSLELKWFHFTARSIRSDVIKRFLSLREHSNYIKRGCFICFSEYFSFVSVLVATILPEAIS